MIDERSVDVHRSFDMVRQLGEGAMGTVWEAIEPELGQSVAVKVLKAEAAEHESLRERFESEAEITASIDHPGSLPVYGIGVTVDGRPFYAMKKVEGDTFEGLFDKRGDRTSDLNWQRRLLEVLQRVAATVGYAHQRGIVHRDLKPDNILIDDFGSVYVADWGIAKRIGDKNQANATVLGQILGTPGYMSPEQARGDTLKAGPEADVFALGVMLYRILTGKSPFEGKDAYAVMLQAQYREPEDPRRSNVWVSRSLAAICSKALQKEPDRRYRDARAMARDLRHHLEGEAVSVAEPTLIESLKRWARQRPWQALAVWTTAIGLVLLVSFVGSQIWLDRRLEQRALAELDLIDGQIFDLGRQLTEIQESRATATGDEAERLSHQWRVGVNRRLLYEFDALSLFADIERLRFLRPDPQLNRVAKKRVFDLIGNAIRANEPEVAAAFVMTLLERHQEGALNVPLTEDEVRRLETLGEEAREMMTVDGQAAVPVVAPEATPETTPEEQ